MSLAGIKWNPDSGECNLPQDTAPQQPGLLVSQYYVILAPAEGLHPGRDSALAELLLLLE